MEEKICYDLLEYPKCLTCRKAKNWIKPIGLGLWSSRYCHETPSKEEYSNLIENSDLCSKSFFNTTTQIPWVGDLKDKLSGLSTEGAADLLKVAWHAHQASIQKRWKILAKQCKSRYDTDENKKGSERAKWISEIMRALSLLFKHYIFWYHLSSCYNIFILWRKSKFSTAFIVSGRVRLWGW